MPTSNEEKSGAGKTPKPITDNMPEKITAHAVRGFRPCFHCDGIGHKDHMILGEAGHDGGEFFHTVCYLKRYSFAAVLRLSARNLGMFRMCDVTTAQMKKIVKAFSEANR